MLSHFFKMKNKNLISLEKKIFTISNQIEFENIALKVFQFQAANCTVYKNYVDFLGVDISDIKKIDQIPFLPITFFKTHKVISENQNEEVIFLSSGTTGMTPSKHFVAKVELYFQSFVKSFEFFYGSIKDYCFLALLPGYLEREGSSLIYMVDRFMKLSNHPDNGFYLYDFDKLAETIEKVKNKGGKYIVFGVTYALLDFAENYQLDLNNGIVLVTGGMKGRRKELPRDEVDQQLKNSFKLKQVHSEYGMTELLSQAYSKGNGLFRAPNWMQILIRDAYDPFTYMKDGKSGGINVVDLANLYSCSFIETKDLGRKLKNGQFEVLGRFDNSDIRGCNLLVS